MNNVFADMVIKTKGKIVFTGSVSGYTPHPTSSVYVASKAALSMYAETLRIEMKPFGVKVIHVATAAVNTGMPAARLDIAKGTLSCSSSSGCLTDTFQTPYINILKWQSTRVGQIWKGEQWARIFMLKG